MFQPCETALTVACIILSLNDLQGFEDQDGRDVIDEAIQWWKQTLDKIDGEILKSTRPQREGTHSASMTLVGPPQL